VSANGSELEMLGYATSEFYFKGLKIEHIIGVVKELSPRFLLGVDFLSANGACIDYSIKPPMFTLLEGLIKLPVYTQCDELNCVTLDRTICIPAFNEANLLVNCPTDINNQDILLLQSPRVSSVTIARAISFCNKKNQTI